MHHSAPAEGRSLLMQTVGGIKVAIPDDKHVVDGLAVIYRHGTPVLRVPFVGDGDTEVSARADFSIGVIEYVLRNWQLQIAATSRPEVFVTYDWHFEKPTATWLRLPDRLLCRSD